MKPIELPGFEIIALLGEGGMGKIYRARQISLDRTVALKVLDPWLAEQLSDSDRFKRATSQLIGLQNQHLVRIYEASTHEGLIYLSMEYVEGHNLRDYQKMVGALSESQALQFALQVAEALKFGWEREKVYHRDLRPGHLLITHDNAVKVIDLGLARLQDELDEAGKHQGIVCMPAYAAPELIREIPISYKADIYALGCVIYFMLTGLDPFEELDQADQFDAHLNKELNDPRHRNAAVRHSTVLFLRKLLAKDPAERASSWDEVIQDLHALLAGQHPTNLPGKELVSTVEYDAVLAEGQHVKATQRIQSIEEKKKRVLRPTGHHKPVAQPSSSSGTRLMMSLVLLLLVLGGGGGAWYFLHQQKSAKQAIADAAKAKSRSAADLEKEKMSDFVNILGAYEAVIQEFPELPVADETRLAIDRTHARKEADAARVIQQLEKQTANLIKNNQHAEAKAVLMDYRGYLAAETESARIALADAIRTPVNEPEPEVPIEPSPPETAALPPFVRAQLKALASEQDKKLEAVETKLKKLETRYEESLATTRKEEITKGVLESVLAIKEERERYAKDNVFLIDYIPLSVHPAIRPLLVNTAQVAKRLYAERDKLHTRKQKLLALKLEAEVNRLTRENQINQALALRATLERIQEMDTAEFDALVRGDSP